MPPQTEYVIGVDVGGTKIASGRVDRTAAVTDVHTLPTLAAEPLETSLTQLFRSIDPLIGNGAKAIGVCAPGPLNPRTGVVLNPPNLPHWRDLPLAALLAERYSLPCRLENDANAAGLAEVRFGAAQGAESALYVTISTGIGTGVILNGKIYHGRNGAAAEGGHVSVDWDSDVVCGCGTPGCIEALASGPAMAARARKRDPALHSAEAIGAAAAAGDRVALEVLDETTDILAAWLGGMVSMLDPDIIVIGGGVSRIGEPLFSRLRAKTPRRTVNQFAAALPIVPAALAGEVGILGAAAVVLET